MEFLREDLPRGHGFTVTHVEHLVAKLDQNESPVDVPEELKETLLRELGELAWNHYPQPHDYYRTKEAFSEAIGIPPENFFISVGCDQAILMAYWLAGGAGRSALIFEPTYPMFRHYATVTGTRARVVNLGAEFRLTPEHITKENVIFLVSPNNPTGNLVEPEVLEAALETGALVFLDEAYYDFSGVTHQELLREHPNLMIGRSLSKSLLAGVRLGYGMARPEVVRVAEELLVVPYHLNLLQLTVARLYPRIRPHALRVARELNAQKERIYRFFRERGVHYYPSHGNFVLFKVEDPDRVYRGLLERGIRIRNVSNLPGLEGHLRVTVGTHRAVSAFLEAMAELL